MYDVTKNVRYLNLAVEQTLLHAELLQDEKTGLIHHAWRPDGGSENYPYWARGNGWMAASLVDLLEVMPASHEKRKTVEDTFRKQSHSLKRVQGFSGMWHTVVDHPETYLESSGTAMIGYSFMKGVRLGVLDETFRAPGRSALDAIKNRVEKGFVVDVSEGTSPAPHVTYYNDRAKAEAQLYGQGFYFHLLAEEARQNKN